MNKNEPFFIPSNKSKILLHLIEKFDIGIKEEPFNNCAQINSIVNKTIKYLFCINPGRSGSHYLSRLLQQIEGCEAYHHPSPVCYGAPMQSFLKGNVRPMKRLMDQKIIEIKRLKGKSCYAETNHCFIKGFGWLIPEYIPQNQIGVIILKRDKQKVINSFMRLGHTPLTPHGRVWYMTPETKDPLNPPPSSWGSVKGYYHMVRFINYILFYRGVNRELLYEPNWIHNYSRRLIDWYIDEVYHWAELYKQSFPGITYYETDLSSLNRTEEVQKMLEYFGFNKIGHLNHYVGLKTNHDLGSFEND